MLNIRTLACLVVVVDGSHSLLAVSRRSWLGQAASGAAASVGWHELSKPAPAACLPGDQDLDCLGYYKEWGLSEPTKELQSGAVSTLLATDLRTVESWEALVKSRDYESIGVQVLEVAPRVRALGDMVCEKRQGLGSCGDIAEEAYASLFELEQSVARAVRRDDSYSPLKLYVVVSEARVAAEDKLRALIRHLEQD